MLRERETRFHKNGLIAAAFKTWEKYIHLLAGNIECVVKVAGKSYTLPTHEFVQCM